ncbi:uncharacterized protein LOC130649142 [Hydractinia symbiolongicarpus]|uniref:uncharacterized protein LOC130649142 n=1 Tax=Hydractinia symbiolongicarpus TaxID=13093 RepID=UPI00254C0A3B|nr:uncharacterized protein LOC130649142 [Hydractinia symbiolongicarpus]
MAAFKILSILGTSCLLLASIMYIVGLVTNKWVVTTFSVDGGQLYDVMNKAFNTPTRNPFLTAPYNKQRFARDLSQKISQYGAGDFDIGNLKYYLAQVKKSPYFRSISINIEASFGLKHVCLDVKVKSDSIPKAFLNQINSLIKANGRMYLKCYSTTFLKESSKLQSAAASNIEGGLGVLMQQSKKLEMDAFDALDKVNVCIILATVFASLALIVSFIKLPCVTIPKKQWIVGITVSLAIIAALSSVAGVAILKKDFHFKDDIEDYKEVAITYLKTYQKEAYAQYAPFFDVIKITEKIGYSHILVCVGIVFLIVAMVMNIGELFSAKKSHDDAYEISLLSSDGYKPANA